MTLEHVGSGTSKNNSVQGPGRVQASISQFCVGLGPGYKILDGSCPGPGSTFPGLFRYEYEFLDP